MTVQDEINIELKKKQHRDDMVRIAKDTVFVHPSGSPERWRAAFLHLMNQRPEARAVSRQVAEMAAEKRNLFIGNKYAVTESKDGAIRATMTLPPFLMDCLKLADPEYFIGKSHRQLSSGTHLKLMRKAFPEFFIPEVI